MKKIVFLVFMAFLGLGTEGVAQSCTTVQLPNQTSAICQLPVGSYSEGSVIKQGVVHIQYCDGCTSGMNNVCTGFIVNTTGGSEAYIITASHCITSQSVLNGATIFFNFEGNNTTISSQIGRAHV